MLAQTLVNRRQGIIKRLESNRAVPATVAPLAVYFLGVRTSIGKDSKPIQ